MKTVNLVYSDKNWIIGKMAKELYASSNDSIRFEDNLGIGVCDADLFLPYDRIKSKKLMQKSKCSIAYFTHYDSKNEKKKERWTIALDADVKIRMNEVKPGVDFYRKKIFGVCGRPYPDGRKNEHFIKALAELGVEIIAWGSPDWGVPVEENREIFYSKIDYLIIPSKNEGGPVPLLEAIACGVPVIAPEVGFCWEYPVVKYKKNNYESLKKVVLQLNNHRTWKNFVDDMIERLR